MVAILNVDPRDAVPIWRQIEDGVRRLAVSGRLNPGSPIPSVRELARDLRVNPATVAKAYQRLTDAGVLVVRRGEGTFVVERPQGEIDEDRMNVLADGAQRYALVVKSVHASLDEAVDALNVALKDAEEGGMP
jgi:GntR family transcriptional regulator